MQLRYRRQMPHLSVEGDVDRNVHEAAQQTEERRRLRRVQMGAREHSQINKGKAMRKNRPESRCRKRQ